MSAVARGAAIATAILSGETRGVIQVANSHALGTVVRDNQGNRKFSQVIPRNSPLPWTEHRNYTPNSDNARRLTLEIWEGDADKDLDSPENVKLTELTLHYAAPAPRAESRFDLEYTYDANGLLHVKAALERTGDVVLDEQVTSFGAGGPTPEVQKELDDLLKLRPEPRPEASLAPVLSRPTPAAASVMKVRPLVSGAVGPEVLVVDGSNLAWIGHSPLRRSTYESEDRPSYAQLVAALGTLAKKYPASQMHVVVDATFRHKVAREEREAVDMALSKGALIQPPAGTEGKGDALVAAIADESGATVVTNDNYVELQNRHPWLLERGRVLGANLTQGVWIFTPRVCVPPRLRA
jgi:hypothetical protein